MSDELEALLAHYRRNARERPSADVDQAILTAAAAHQRRQSSPRWRYAAAAALVIAGFTADVWKSVDRSLPSVPESRRNGEDTARTQLYLLTADFSLATRSDEARQLLEQPAASDPYLPSS